MARPRSGEREYILDRWLPVLIDMLNTTAEEKPEIRRMFLKAPHEEPPRRNYRGCLDVSVLASFIATNDPASGDAITWQRNLNRWINRERKPSPDLIRRCSQAIGYDWLIALGRSGYRQHALCLLWGLFCVGRRTELESYALALFPHNDSDTIQSKNAKYALTEISLPHDAERFVHLKKASKACWKTVEDQILPESPTPPPSMASPLHAAWMLIDSAFSSNSGPLEIRLRGHHNMIARLVSEWIDSLSSPSKLRPDPHSTLAHPTTRKRRK